MPGPRGRRPLQSKEAWSPRAFSAGHGSRPLPQRPTSSGVCRFRLPEAGDWLLPIAPACLPGRGRPLCSLGCPSQESCRRLPETHAAGKVASPSPRPPLHALWRPPPCLCKVSTAKSLEAPALVTCLRLSGLTGAGPGPFPSLPPRSRENFPKQSWTQCVTFVLVRYLTVCLWGFGNTCVSPVPERGTIHHKRGLQKSCGIRRMARVPRTRLSAEE